MLDSIKMAWIVGVKPAWDDLVTRGWSKQFDQSTGRFRSWFFKEKKGTGIPYLAMFTAPDGTVYLTVFVSLPAFVFGSNVRLPNQNETNEGLVKLARYVASKSGISFDLDAAFVWEIHFTMDLPIGEALIFQTLEHISRMPVKGFTKGRYHDSTVYYHSLGPEKTREKPRTICIYDKRSDSISKRCPREEVDAAGGILRVEYRYNNRASVKRLLSSLRSKEKIVREIDILTEGVSKEVLKPIENQIDELRLRDFAEDPLIGLMRKYGARRARTLYTFLNCLQRYGEGFHKLHDLGFSRSSYYACLKDCRAAGIYFLSDPAL
jgi:hypothetical protein